MTLALIVYLISISENITSFLQAGGACVLIVVFCVGLWSVINESSFPKKLSAWMAIIAALFFGLAALIPSEKAGYAIAAAYGAQQVYQSEEAKEIGSKLLKVINNKLDEAAKENK